MINGDKYINKSETKKIPNIKKNKINTTNNTKWKFIKKTFFLKIFGKFFVLVSSKRKCCT